MVNTELLEYIKQQIAQGLAKEAIQQNLVTAGGWNLVDVNNAFATLELNQPAHNPTTSAGSVPTPPVNVKYAGFWIRFVAISVDSIIISIVNFIVQLPFTINQYRLIFGAHNSSDIASLSHPSVMTQIISISLYLVVTWGYFSLMTYYKGATLGKMLVGIQVKADNFEKLSFGRVLLRETVGKLVSQIILCIGFIIAGVTQKKQGLHDMFAKSIVVYKDPSNKHTVGLVIGIIIALIIPALLTAIAIVGMLSSVVLVSLNSAREKAADARVRSVLMQMRTQAEVYYGNNDSYSKSRDCSSGMFADPAFAPIKAQLATVKGSISCYAEGETYAISGSVSQSQNSLDEGAQNYCVDSTGYNKPGIAVDDGSTASCKIISPRINNSNI